MKRWPWRRQRTDQLLAVSWSDGTLAYARARLRGDGRYDVHQFGVEQQGQDSMEAFVDRLDGLGLKGFEVLVMLRPEQYQVLQVEAPSVPPEEMRAAARWQIKEMLDVHVDDVTLDILKVGDGQQKGASQLFVVAATNAQLRMVMALGEAMQWTVPVIDIQDTAQRNLQSALARLEGRLPRATAALVLVDEWRAVLTISANEELFYTRRLELAEGLMSGSWWRAGGPTVGDSTAATQMSEYVPDYSVDGVSYGTDYSSPHVATVDLDPDSDDNEGAQRLLVEVQRSLDLWDRTWSGLPLAGLQVYAGANTQALASWLGREMGQTVQPMDVSPLFNGVVAEELAAHALCWPLLGALMRSDADMA